MEILEWNIHGAAGYGNYSIPKFVTDELILKYSNIDLIVLTEFVFASGWNYLKESLEKNYRIISSPYISGQNGVLIAVKKDIKDYDIESVRVSCDMNTSQIEKPNFLQVTINAENTKQPTFIIGTRIRDADHIPQYKALKEHLDSISRDCKIICTGDFNEWQSHVVKKLGNSVKVITPQFKMKPNDFNSLNTWSAILKNRRTGNIGKALIDHILVRNAKVTNIKYMWDFVNKENGYGSIRPEDYKSNLNGCPDHAILIGNIE